MPHSNGRIYTETRGGIKYGIDPLEDVSPVLGIVSGDYGTVCTHQNINPDALFKPYEYNAPVVPNFATGGPNGLFGYSVPFTRSNLWDIAKQRWAFNPPTTWFRTLDFEGYNHNVNYASNPWGMTVVETDSTLMCNLSWAGPAEFVCPKNFPLWADCYMAVAIFVGSEFRYAKCHNQKIGSVTGAQIQIYKDDVDFTSDTIGKLITVVPFIIKYYFQPTDYIGVLSVDKWTINYNSDQFKVLNGTAPYIEYSGITVERRQYFIRVSGTVTNLTSSQKTYVFYPEWRVFELYEGQEYLLYDRMNFGPDTPQRSLELPANGSASFYFDLSASEQGQVIDVTNACRIDLKFHSPSDASMDYYHSYPL